MAATDGDLPGPSEVTDSVTDRRSALRKLGVGAAAAWAVPAILSQHAAAAATDQPPPSGCGGCVSPTVVNASFESPVVTSASFPYAAPTGWTRFSPFFIGVYRYTDAPFVVPPPDAGGQFLYWDGDGDDDPGVVLAAQTVGVAAPCGDGTHRAVLRFWYWTADQLQASVRFSDGTGVLDTYLSPPLGPAAPAMAPFVSPSIVVPTGTTQAEIQLLYLRGLNVPAAFDLVDLSIC